MAPDAVFPLISVIIVNYNGGKVLSQCLSALEKQTVKNFEIIIVDNGSTDSFLELVEKGKKNLRILKMGKNTGFAFASNRGAEIARGKWISMLNNDAFPEPQWIEKLLKAVKNFPEFSFFASHQILYYTPDKFDGTGDMYSLNGRAWRRDHQSPLEEGVNWNDEVFGACAAASLYEASCFTEVGGFDEDYFCYFEDVDLSLRLRLSGFRCMHVSDAKVYHVGSVTSGGESSEFALFHGYRNLVWTYFKSMPLKLLLKNFHTHILLNCFQVLHLVHIRRRRLILKIYWSIFKGFAKLMLKRSKIQRLKCITSGELQKVMMKESSSYVKKIYMSPR